MEFIDKITAFVSGLYMDIPGFRMYAFIGIMAVILLGFLLIFIPSVKDASIRINETQTKRDLDFKKAKKNRYVSDRMNNKLAVWLDDTFKFSRYYTKGRAKTSWQFFERTIYFSVFAFAFGALILTIPFASVMFIATWFIRYGYLTLLRMKNNKEVESEMVMFLNMLNNYSTGNTEIISVFGAIAHRFKPILRECLIECVQEAQGTMGTWQALANLGRKIESRKFREVLKSLEVSQKYSGGFYQTVQALRLDSQAYVNEKKKLTGVIKENLITLGVVVVALIAIIGIMGGMLEDGNVWAHFLEPIGIICIVVFMGVMGWFLAQLVSINK